MPTNTWAIATDVSAHATSDSNTTTEVSGSTLRTKLWSDLFGSAIDGDHWQEFASGPDIGFTPTALGSFVESGGQFSISIPFNAGSPIGRALEATKTFAAGVALDVSTKVNITGADGGSGVQFTTSLILWTGSGQYYMEIRIDRDEIRFQRLVNGGATVVGVLAGSGGQDRDLSFRITRSAANVWEAFYDLAGGTAWTSLGTITQDYASTMKVCLATSAGEQDSTVTANFTEFKQDDGGIYWTKQTVILTNKAIDYALIDWSTLVITTETGTVTFDYSTDGGSTYTGTFRTTAAMQALADEPCTRLQFQVKFNGGGQTAIASIAGLAIDTVFLGSQTPRQYYTRSGI